MHVVRTPPLAQVRDRLVERTAMATVIPRPLPPTERARPAAQRFSEMLSFMFTAAL